MGKQTLKIDIKLCKAAREHSTDMKKHNFFSHTSPLPGKKTPADRAKKHGTSCRGENIAGGSDMPAKTFMQWFKSPGHHENMMGPHSQIGVGYHETQWTEMFK